MLSDAEQRSYRPTRTTRSSKSLPGTAEAGVRFQRADWTTRKVVRSEGGLLTDSRDRHSTPRFELCWSEPKHLATTLDFDTHD